MANNKQQALFELRSMIIQARSLFEEMLESSIGVRETAGTCLYATIMCRTLIERFSPFQPQIRGGDGDGDGGLWVDGICHGHYWVEIAVAGELYIADITADQFGQDSVILSPATSLLVRYEAGDQEIVDEHVSNELSRMIET
jgi:hypothetical protein